MDQQRHLNRHELKFSSISPTVWFLYIRPTYLAAVQYDKLDDPRARVNLWPSHDAALLAPLFVPIASFRWIQSFIIWSLDDWMNTTATVCLLFFSHPNESFLLSTVTQGVQRAQQVIFSPDHFFFFLQLSCAV
jgi:hypothetical protein